MKTVADDLSSIKTEIINFFNGQEKEYTEQVESEFYKIINLLFCDAKEKSISFFNEDNNKYVSRNFEISYGKKEKFYNLTKKFNEGDKSLLQISSSALQNGNHSVQLKLYPKGIVK